MKVINMKGKNTFNLVEFSSILIRFEKNRNQVMKNIGNFIKIPNICV